MLPPLSEIATSSGSADLALTNALSTLLEPTPVLLDTLVPQVATDLEGLESYSQLIDRAFGVIAGWDDALKAQFIHGHPRIGEVKQLSALSKKEQSGGSSSSSSPTPTPPEVLARLAFLNAVYEKRYPGLLYITFVNGRSRAQIRDEMEGKLGAEMEVPRSEEDVDLIRPHDVTSQVWRDELERAVGDVAKIAKSRLKTLGVE